MRYIKRFTESYNQEEMEYPEMEYSEIKMKRNRSDVTGKLIKNSYSLYVDGLLWTQNISFQDDGWTFLFGPFANKFINRSGPYKGTITISIKNVDEVISYLEECYRMEKHKPIATEINKRLLDNMTSVKRLLIDMSSITPEDVTEKTSGEKETYHPWILKGPMGR
jgi:regulatory protein YycH of two-component signal transduction system YycFG